MRNKILAIIFGVLYLVLSVSMVVGTFLIFDLMTEKYHVTVISDYGLLGTVTLIDGEYEENTIITLSATIIESETFIVTFDGWYLEDELLSVNTPYVFTVSNTDVSIIGRFSSVQIEYNITYNLVGGTNHVSNPTKYTVESNITLQDPTKFGYTFTGWTPASTIEVGTTGHKTFTATWEVIDYTIIYDLAGGVNHPSNPNSYNIENETISLNDPTQEGFTFAGWVEGNSIISGSTGNKTFTATWEVIEYNITYNLVGGTNHVSNPTKYTVESNITLQDPTKFGYTFTDWTPASTIEVGTTGHKTFTATWEVIEYNITYNLVGGTNHVSNPTKYTVESNITLQDPTKFGYTFTGWTPASTIEVGTTGHKTFTATWEVIDYTIIYDLAGGVNHPSNPNSYNIENETISLNDPTQEGFTFAGWVEGNSIISGSTGNKTFTATWVKVYSINYELNGGINGLNPLTYSSLEYDVTII